jgi:hypothetical protein
MRLRTPLAAIVAAALAATLAPAAATPTSGSGHHWSPTPPASATTGAFGPKRQASGGVLDTYLADTWKSFTAMVDPDTGLVSDNVGGDLTGRASYTSPTNIGAYLWSTVVAEDTGLITLAESRTRIRRTLATLRTMEKHEPSGMFYNWYDPATGKKLTTWPADGSTVYPFLSSVDNGWLATGLLAVARSDPKLAGRANPIRSKMDFSYFYDESAGAKLTGDQPVGGQISGGFWVDPPPGCSQLLALKPGTDPVYQTCHRYGAFNTEPRMASYLGIAAGQIPTKHYWGPVRTFYNDNCDYSWTETKPIGGWKTYDGIPVFEGALGYRDVNVVPTWGGSMFEALMVPLFVPEDQWGPRSWGVNHPLYVRGQIEHGLDDAQYGYWGFSPSNNPAGGYREYGVDALGMDAGTPEGGGYTSDQQRTVWDQPYEGCRDGDPTPPAPEEYGDGVVTPHASFLAYRYAPQAALDNLAKLRANFDAYGPGGFYDAIDVTSKQVSKRYLSLDQGMIMAALGNALAGNDMRRYVSKGAMQEKLEPLMREEVFSAGER